MLNRLESVDVTNAQQMLGLTDSILIKRLHAGLLTMWLLVVCDGSSLSVEQEILLASETASLSLIGGA